MWLNFVGDAIYQTYDAKTLITIFTDFIKILFTFKTQQKLKELKIMH